MIRSSAHALPAVAATLLFAGCVDLTQPLALQQATGGDQGGTSASGTATGGGGGTATVASGGSAGGAATGGTKTGGTTATGGAGGGAAPDAAVDATVRADGTIDVPSSPDVILPADRGTGGSTAGATGSGGGTAGQAGSVGGGQTSTGGTVVAGSGGGGTAGQAGSAVGGTGGVSSTATGGAGATGGTTTATGGATTPTCTPVPKSTGGIDCPGGFCTTGAYMGYDFPIDDKTGKSTVCMSSTSLCGAGTTGAQNPPAYTVFGAGFGFSLSPETRGSVEVPVQLTGTSVKVVLTSLPTNADMRLQVKHYVGTTGVAYCAVMTTATQTIPWVSFNTTCWDPAKGVPLTGPPNTSNFQFLASSRATAGSFDFCVTSLSFQ